MLLISLEAVCLLLRSDANNMLIVHVCEEYVSMKSEHMVKVKHHSGAIIWKVHFGTILSSTDRFKLMREN